MPEHPNGVAIFVNVPLLLLVTLNVAFEHAMNARLHVPQIIRMRERLETVRAQFLFGVTQQFAKRFVHLQPAAVHRNHGHSDRGVIKRSMPVTLFTRRDAEGN